MIHPHTELKFINHEIGFGVFATRFIPKGTIVWAQDKLDRIFTPDQVNEFGKPYTEILEKYCYRDPVGNFVLCWDNSRFINHSYNSSLITTPYNFELAIRDIHPGEEITDDYGYLNISEPMPTAPENGTERKAVYPDDLLYYHKEWDAKLAEAFMVFEKAEQPLFSFLDTETQKKALSIAQGKQKMDSILTCYYPGNKKREEFKL